MNRAEAVENLRGEYELLRHAMDGYYTALSRHQCEGGKTIQKEVSNRGLGSLRARDTKMVAVFARLDREEGRALLRAVDDAEELLAQLVRAVKRYCQRDNPWTLAREKKLSASYGFLRGFVEGRKGLSTSTEAPAVTDKPKAPVAPASPAPQAPPAVAAPVKPVAPPVLPQAEKPKASASVASRLHSCAQKAITDNGFKLSEFSLSVPTGKDAKNAIRVAYKDKAEIFYAKEHHLSVFAACRRIASFVEAQKEKPAMTTKPALPGEMTMEAILASQNRKAWNHTSAEILRELAEKHTISVGRLAELTGDHRKLVVRGIEAGFHPTAEVLAEHGLPTPKVAAHPTEKTLETLEGLATFNDKEAAFLKRLAEMPAKEAEEKVKALEQEVNKKNKGIQSVLDGERPVGLFSSASTMSSVTHYNRNEKRQARTKKVEVSIGGKAKANQYFVVYLDGNEKKAIALATHYGSLVSDELRDRGAVTAERYATLSRMLGYSDGDIRQFFLAKQARRVVNERKAGDSGKRPEVKFSRLVGANLEAGFKGRPLDADVVMLEAAGFKVVTGEKDSPFWRAIYSEAGADLLKRLGAEVKARPAVVVTAEAVQAKQEEKPALIGGDNRPIITGSVSPSGAKLIAGRMEEKQLRALSGAFPGVSVFSEKNGRLFVQGSVDSPASFAERAEKIAKGAGVILSLEVEDAAPVSIEAAKASARGLPSGGVWLMLGGFPHYVSQFNGKAVPLNFASVEGVVTRDEDWSSEEAETEFERMVDSGKVVSVGGEYQFPRSSASAIAAEFAKKMSSIGATQAASPAAVAAPVAVEVSDDDFGGAAEVAAPVVTPPPVVAVTPPPVKPRAPFVPSPAVGKQNGPNEKSDGHVAFYMDGKTKCELFKDGDGNLYRAPVSNVFDITTNMRSGRFEAPPHMADDVVKRILEQSEKENAPTPPPVMVIPPLPAGSASPDSPLAYAFQYFQNEQNSKDDSAKFADDVIISIETGRFDPGPNHILNYPVGRKLFRELTGVELPADRKQRAAMFTGKPFPYTWKAPKGLLFAPPPPKVAPAASEAPATPAATVEAASTPAAPPAPPAGPVLTPAQQAIADKLKASMAALGIRAKGE